MVKTEISLHQYDQVTVWHDDGDCVRRKDFLFVNIKDGLAYFQTYESDKKIMIIPLARIVRMETDDIRK